MTEALVIAGVLIAGLSLVAVFAYFRLHRARRRVPEPRYVWEEVFGPPGVVEEEELPYHPAGSCGCLDE